MEIDDKFLKELIDMIESAKACYESALLDENFLKEMDMHLGEISIISKTNKNNDNKTNSS